LNRNIFSIVIIKTKLQNKIGDKFLAYHMIIYIEN